MSITQVHGKFIEIEPPRFGYEVHANQVVTWLHWYISRGNRRWGRKTGKKHEIRSEEGCVVVKNDRAKMVAVFLPDRTSPMTKRASVPKFKYDLGSVESPIATLNAARQYAVDCRRAAELVHSHEQERKEEWLRRMAMERLSRSKVPIHSDPITPRSRRGGLKPEQAP